MNEFILFGSVIQKPELVKSESGLTYANLLLKVEKSFKNKESAIEFDEFQLTAFNNIAGELCETVKTSMPLFVKGHINVNKNTSKEGKIFYSTSLIIEHFTNLKAL